MRSHAVENSLTDRIVPCQCGSPGPDSPDLASAEEAGERLHRIKLYRAEARLVAGLVQDMATCPPGTDLAERAWSGWEGDERLEIPHHDPDRASRRLGYLAGLLGEESLAASREESAEVVAGDEDGPGSPTLGRPHPYADPQYDLFTLVSDAEDERRDSRLDAELTEGEVAGLFGFWWRGGQGLLEVITFEATGRSELHVWHWCDSRMACLAPYLGEEFHRQRARAEGALEDRRERRRREAGVSNGVDGDGPDAELRRRAREIMYS